MEGRMVVVKNLPSCSQDTIENYLEVVCDNGVQDIQFYDKRAKHIAMVTMEDEIEDVQNCLKKAKKRKLEGNTVELVDVAPPRGVLVTDLPSNITEDTIRYYFENRRSGGEDEAVEDCNYHKNLGVATVVFKDKAVVQRVLNITAHTPIKSKPKVTVQPYYPEFHEDVLDFLADLDPCDSSSGGDTSPVSDSPAKDNFQFWENMPQGSSIVDRENPMKSVVSASSIKDQIKMFEGERFQETSKQPQSNHMVSIYERIEQKSEEDSSMVSICGSKQDEEVLYMRSLCEAVESDRREEPMHDIADDIDEEDLFEGRRRKIIDEPMHIVETHQTSARPSPPKPAPKPRNKSTPHAVHPAEQYMEDKLDLPPANVKLLRASQKVDMDFPKCQLAYDTHSGAVSMIGPEADLHKLKMRLYEESNSLTRASNPLPQNILEPEPEPEVKERTIKASVKLTSANVRLLEASHKVDTEFPMCKLTYKADSGTIDMEGPETKLQESKLRLYEENHNVSCASHSVPQTIADILKTEKGRSYLDKELKGGNSVWYLEGNTIHCATFSTSDTDDFIGHVKRLIQQEYISYNESHFHFLNSSAWTDLKNTLEKDYMVRIVSDRKQCQVRIDGLDQDVNICKRQIEKELKSHSHKSGTFTLSGAKAKCLKGLFVQDIDGLKKAVSDGGGRWDDSGNMNSFNVKFDGDSEMVKKVELALKHIVEKKVWHERLVLGKDVAKEKDLNLLIRGLHRTNLKALQAAFEAQHSVFLELNLPGVKKELDMPSAVKPDQSSVYKRREEQRSLPRTRSLEDVNSDSETEELAIFPSFRQTTRHLSPRLYTPREISPPRKPMSNSMNVGNIKILVKRGDISKEKVDVLVNVVPKNWDVTGTAVSQAFVKAGGEEFKQQIASKSAQTGHVGAMLKVVQVLQAQGAPAGIVQTKSCGNQPGKMIYTIALDKWNPPGSKMELKKLIESCLQTAANNGYSSIALTSVGCGKLLHFPEKYVASCLVNAVKANSKLPNLKQVSMVLFDQSTYQTFLNEINPDTPRRPSIGRHMPDRTVRHSRSYADIDPFDQPPPPSSSITVGATNITVQQGDITRIKATVLVNVVTGDLDLGSTAVSQAFARAGGRALLQDFENKKNSPATNNIIVTSGGNLSCQYVYHVVLKKWHPTTEKEYQDTVRDCFKLAGGYNTPSIAFPSLGCGVLFKYPSDFVVSCLLAEAKSASIANVTFVIYDRPVLDAFLQELGSDGDGDDGSENMDTLRKYAKTSKTDRVPSSDNKSANIVIYGTNKPTCTTAKVALSKQLSADYLHVELIKNENLTRLTGRMFASLKSNADKNGIWIKFPDPDKKKNKDKPELKLKGEKKSVLFAKSQIQDILMNAITKTIQRPCQAARGARGSRQFLLDMGHMSDFSSPSYWTHFKPKHPLRDILSGVWSKIAGPKQVATYKLVTVDTATFNAIDTLVQKTWDSTLVGHGKDAVGLQHQSLKVKQVQRLEHPDMYIKYCQKRSGRFSDACSSGPFSSIDKLPGSKSAARTTMFTSAELQRDVYPEVNEHYFFHGTKAANLQAILTQGLDSRVGNTGAMFGSGVYGAESSTKADQYTDDKSQRTPGDKQMVLMRMTLGHPYVCSTPKKYCRPPCRDMGHLDDKCTKPHGFFHSVVGDGQWLFREFVVYEPDLCYPEYVITYARA